MDSEENKDMERLQADFDFNKILEECKDQHPATSADRLKEFEASKICEVLTTLTKEMAAEIFGHFSKERQLEIALVLEDQPLAQLVTNMSNDERVDFFQNLPDARQVSVFRLLAKSEREDILRLASHEEGTAGAVMTSEYVSLPQNLTAEQAIGHLRREASRKETIYASYVLDSNRKLIGVVSLTDLILATPSQPLADIMTTDVIRVDAADDQEMAATQLAKYDLIAIPVVDDMQRLVGIITADDVIDVVQEEASEDIQKFGGVEALDAPYLDIGFLHMLRKRAGWLMALFVGEMFTATAMGHYEKQIEQAVVLALFIPLIISSGGNAGSQASTLIIRAMALGEVKLKDWWRVFLRELLSGLALGLILGAFGLMRIVFWPARDSLYGEHFVLVGLTVSFSLVGIVLWGSLAGSMLPFFLRRLRLDPATASAPFVATLVDVTGLIIYFSLASMILGGTLL